MFIKNHEIGSKIANFTFQRIPNEMQIRQADCFPFICDAHIDKITIGIVRKLTKSRGFKNENEYPSKVLLYSYMNNLEWPLVLSLLKL